MRIRLLATVVACCVLAAGCAVITGSGRVATEMREVSGFTQINLDGNGEVTIEEGDEETLTIEADDNVLSALTSEVSDGTLKLGTKQGTTIRTSNPIRYRVTMTELTGISLSGSGAVNGNDLTIRTVRIDISGSGTVNLSGSGEEQDIRLSGSGRYDGAQLSSAKVNAEISGSGEILVAVSAELRVDISGSGSVTYSGDPRIEQSISGSGRLIKK